APWLLWELVLLLRLDFFFSRRRRHTRCYRDWSSDVCSSDLLILHDPEFRCVRKEHLIEAGKQVRLKENIRVLSRLLKGLDGLQRSEERRVGRECRSRGTTKGYKHIGR